MKLKKIASLMLAGVMAVSMLAGCSGDGNKEENGGNTEIKPTVSNAVSVMNDAQSAVKFEANSDFDAALAAAAKKAAHSDVKEAKYTVSQVAKNNDVSKELAKKLDVDANLIDTGDDIYFNALTESADKGGRSATVTGLWIGTKYEKYPATVTLNTDGKTYAASYTGNVSIVTVNTSDKGETATAYYIAVSVTQTLARDAQTNVKG